MSMGPGLLALCTVVSASVGCGKQSSPDTPPPPMSGSAVSVPLRRVPTYELEVPHPGITVIRDSAHWRELWRRYGRHSGKSLVNSYSVNGPDSLFAGPRVNFSENALIAIGAGEASGCGNRADFIRRLDRIDDTLVATVDIPAALSMTGPCDGGIAPVDVVLIPAGLRDIAVWDAAGKTLAPLDTAWWHRPHSFVDVEKAPNGWHAEYRIRLAEDSTASLADLRNLAMTLDAELSEGVAWTLLRNPRVRGDVGLLRILANLQGQPGLHPYGDVVKAARKLMGER
jgi:hypothetical protein